MLLPSKSSVYFLYFYIFVSCVFIFLFLGFTRLRFQMPSPSNPLEYRPTPHLILIVIFVFLPLIYLCGRLAVTSCFILLLVLKSMFSPVLQLFYGNELSPIPQIRYASSAQIMASTMQEAQTEQYSDEQVNTHISYNWLFVWNY